MGRVNTSLDMLVAELMCPDTFPGNTARLAGGFNLMELLFIFYRIPYFMAGYEMDFATDIFAGHGLRRVHQSFHLMPAQVMTAAEKKNLATSAAEAVRIMEVAKVKVDMHAAC